jgi:hypothetical protein
MTIPPAWPQVLDFFGAWLGIVPSAGLLSGDAGLVPVRQLDQRIGLTLAFVRIASDRLERWICVTPREVAAWRDYLPEQGLVNASARRKTTAEPHNPHASM